MSDSPWSNEVWVTTNTYPPAGTDEWDGLTPNKFASTLQELLDMMDTLVAGDILGVYPGTYVGTQRRTDLPPSSEANRLYPAFALKNNGTANSFITIVAQYPYATTNGPYTDIRSGGTEHPYDSGHGRERRHGWPAFGAGYYDGGKYSQWIGIYSDSSDSNNMIHEDGGVCDFRGKNDIIISKCGLFGSVDASWANGNGNNYSAIRWEECVDVIARDNDMRRFGSSSNGHPVNMFYVENYLIEHNYMADSAEGVDCKLGGIYNEMHGTIRYNVFEGLGTGIIHTGNNIGKAGERSVDHNNLFINCGYTINFSQLGAVYQDAIDFYNNTIYGGTAEWPGTIQWTSIKSSYNYNNTFYNNIFSGLTYYLGIAYTVSDGAEKLAGWGSFDNNCLHNTTSFILHGAETLTFAQWQSTHGQDEYSITSSPMFVDASNKNFRLQPGSPCWTNGVGSGVQGCYITGNETIGIR